MPIVMASKVPQSRASTSAVQERALRITAASLHHKTRITSEPNRAALNSGVTSRWSIPRCTPKPSHEAPVRCVNNACRKYNATALLSARLARSVMRVATFGAVVALLGFACAGELQLDPLLESSWKKSTEIYHVPHFDGDLPSRIFGGYLDVVGTNKKLFYILVHSQRSPEHDPLLFWTNGGPGCSSMGAFFEEHGPFKTSTKGYGAEPALMLEDVKLRENPESWSKVANVLYVDMPAGTGLSYSTDKSDYVTNDTQATQDMYQALRAWFEVYPEFKGRDFYLSGESYAGIYVPLLASLIVTGNAQAIHEIKLKGYLIGNPTTNNDQYYRLAEYYQGLNLISEELLNQIETAQCTLQMAAHNQSAECQKLKAEVEERVKPTFFFDVLVNCFYGMQTFNKLRFEEMKANLSAAGIDYQDPLYGGSTDHCDYDDRASGYLLNEAEVREAIHAAPFADSQGALAGFFEMCQGRLNYTRVTENTVPIHHANIRAGLTVLIYSGDHDRVVPTAGTAKWTRELGAKLGVQTANYEPWWVDAPKFFGPQIGGYISLWDGLAFATIRGAGHQVPTHKPAEMLLLLSHFLEGNLAALTQQPSTATLVKSV